VTNPPVEVEEVEPLPVEEPPPDPEEIPIGVLALLPDESELLLEFVELELEVVEETVEELD